MLEALGIDSEAESVYRFMLAHPAMGLAELAARLGASEQDVGAALERLSGLTLLRRSEDGTLRPVRPEIGIERLLARQETALAARQQQIQASRLSAAQLISECADLAQGAEDPESERLLGIEAIRDRIAELSGQLRREVMTFAPGGAQRPSDIAAARELDQGLLRRGVRMRTLWLDSIRNHRPTLEYATWLQSLGAQIRTAPTLPVRMIIMDRTCALLPMNTADATAGAVVLHGEGTVAALCALFESVWYGAERLGPDAAEGAGEGPTPQEAEILRLLARGLTDQAVALRLEVSHRTARRMVAALMTKLGARSRFEAGIKAAARGWVLSDQ